MKKIKYKVTGPFGLRNEGDILDAYILFEDIDGDTVLVYHPSSRKHGECGMLEFCKEKKGVYVSYGEGYINLGHAGHKLIKKAFKG